MSKSAEWFESMRGQEYDDFIEEVGLDLEDQFNELMKEETGDKNGLA